MFAPLHIGLVIVVQRYVCTKLEVSAAFLFWENWRHAGGLVVR